MNRVSIILLFFLTGCSISDRDWSNLKGQLAEIQKKDQQYRVLMDSIGRTEGWQSEKINELLEKQSSLDSTNLIEVDRIIDKFGFPPKEKVGDLTETVFRVLQRSNDSTMATYYDLVVASGMRGDLKMAEVATYQDRVLMMRRVPQEYGTQVWIEFKTDPHTGRRYDSLYLWKVRNPERVNARRTAVGLDSLETHLRRFGIDPSKGYLIRKN